MCVCECVCTYADRVGITNVCIWVLYRSIGQASFSTARQILCVFLVFVCVCVCVCWFVRLRWSSVCYCDVVVVVVLFFCFRSNTLPSSRGKCRCVFCILLSSVFVISGRRTFTATWISISISMMRVSSFKKIFVGSSVNKKGSSHILYLSIYRGIDTKNSPISHLVYLRMDLRQQQRTLKEKCRDSQTRDATLTLTLTLTVYTYSAAAATATPTHVVCIF